MPLEIQNPQHKSDDTFCRVREGDILHFSYYNKSLSKLIKIPYVLTVYDLIHERLNIHQKKFDKRFPIQNAKKIICISNQTKIKSNYT